MQDEVGKLREYLRRNGLSQAALAKKSDVSQSTVSRSLSGRIQRHGSARQKLFTYIEIGTYERVELDSESPRLKVVAAFDQIWDQTEAHAEAVAKVIQSLADLKPKKTKMQE